MIFCFVLAGVEARRRGRLFHPQALPNDPWLKTDVRDRTDESPAE